MWPLVLEKASPHFALKILTTAKRGQTSTYVFQASASVMLDIMFYRPKITSYVIKLIFKG